MKTVNYFEKTNSAIESINNELNTIGKSSLAIGKYCYLLTTYPKVSSDNIIKYTKDNKQIMLSYDDISELVGLSKSSISKYIKAYKFLEDNKDIKDCFESMLKDCKGKKKGYAHISEIANNWDKDKTLDDFKSYMNYSYADLCNLFKSNDNDNSTTPTKATNKANVLYVIVKDSKGIKYKVPKDILLKYKMD